MPAGEESIHKQTGTTLFPAGRHFTNRAKLGGSNVCPEGLKVVGRFLDRVLATVWAPIHASEIQGSGQRIIWTGNELASGWWGGNLGYGSKVSFPNFSEQKLGQGDAP